MNGPIDLFVETNELLNSQYFNLKEIIMSINQHDAPDEPINNEYLAANYDPNQFDIYIKNIETNVKRKKTKLQVDQQDDNVRRVFEANATDSDSSSQTTESSRDSSSTSHTSSSAAFSGCSRDFVKYGRGWVKKNTNAYLDMRKRNNEAIQKCRRNKIAKTCKGTEKSKGLTLHEAASGEQKEIIEELVKEIKFLNNFLDVLSINEDKGSLNLKYEELNSLLSK
jgi:hypothetical protein